MSKGTACFLCWLPIVIAVLEALFILFVAIGVIPAEGGTIQAAIVGLTMVVGYLATVVAEFGVMIWLIVRTVKQTEWDTTCKVVWVICLLLFSAIIYPIYYFACIRKE
ncbi:MAG: hypothetical protein IJP29_02600 [Lachnospiraceae bacterium]|nr:hypothetical protein [Lachnospiraceae bacterium]